MRHGSYLVGAVVAVVVAAGAMTVDVTGLVEDLHSKAAVGGISRSCTEEVGLGRT